MNLPIEIYLKRDYDKLKRNEIGVVMYDKELKQVADNLLKHPEMQSYEYDTYDAFFNGLLRKVPNPSLYELPKEQHPEYRYINQVLIRDLWATWKQGNRVFIAAGTGKGKNTFVKMELLRCIENTPNNKETKIVIFENRTSLMQQQIVDIVKEIDPERLQYEDLSKTGMVVIGSDRNIMIVTYQTAAQKIALQDRNFNYFLSHASYLVFDEAHYMLDDASFNKGINFFMSAVISSFHCSNAIKIYLSGSMEEFYSFYQLCLPFKEQPADLIEQKFIFDKSSFAFLFRNNTTSYNGVEHLVLPTDYSYIQPYYYNKYEDLCNYILRSDPSEKWLIFVMSKEDGRELYVRLSEKIGNAVCFITAQTKESKENAKIYKQLILESKFDCRILIATTVIYNGVNVKDPAVKHLVLPFTTVPNMKQMIGRKRMDEDENVNVYFYNATFSEVYCRYINCIKDYMALLDIRQNIDVSSFLQLNGMATSASSKFYYLQGFPYQIQSNNQIYNRTTFLPVLNDAVIYKLYCDTCYYTYLLQRIESNQKSKSVLTDIWLKHLGIESKTAEEIKSAPKTSTVTDESISNLSAYLEKLVSSPITVPDCDGSYEAFLELKRLLNEYHKFIYGGQNIDTQWKNKDRFFSEQKIKALMTAAALPYLIKTESANGIRTVTVTRTDVVK